VNTDWRLTYFGIWIRKMSMFNSGVVGEISKDESKLSRALGNSRLAALSLV
jgi:hypothetical protein